MALRWTCRKYQTKKKKVDKLVTGSALFGGIEQYYKCVCCKDCDSLTDYLDNWHEASKGNSVIPPNPNYAKKASYDVKDEAICNKECPCKCQEWCTGKNNGNKCEYAKFSSKPSK